MMSKTLVKDTRTPLAVVYASKGGKLEPLLDRLSGIELQLYRANKPEDLGVIGLQENKHYCICVLDLTAPGVHFLEYLEQVDVAFRGAGGPVIAIVDGNTDYDAKELVRIGASKVVDVGLGVQAINVILAAEIEEFRQVSRLRKELLVRTTAIGHIVSGEFKFMTRREAQGLASMLASASPSPIPVSIGLTELLVNSVEHGCLEIGHDEKGALIDDGTLHEEVRRRRALPEFSERYVTLNFTRNPTQLKFHVKDGGKGFDYEAYAKADAGHEKKHGRGIIMAYGCFDTIEYRGCGNEVIAVHKFEGEGLDT